MPVVFVSWKWETGISLLQCIPTAVVKVVGGWRWWAQCGPQPVSGRG